MVREVLRDALPALVERAVVERAGSSVQSTGSSGTEGRERVSLSSDADIDAFVQRIVTLAENPVTRQQLRTGRLRFTRGDSAVSAAAEAGTLRLERGALTERHVRAAAASGQRIVLAKGVAVTPLARDRARTLSVEITKES